MTLRTPTAPRRHGPRRWRHSACAGAVAAVLAAVPCGASQESRAATPSAPVSTPELPAEVGAPLSLEAGKHHFYNARFETAVEVTRALEAQQPDDLAVHELRSSALLFQLKRLLEPRGKKVLLKSCPSCPELIRQFTADFHHARDMAKARVAASPDDVEARFFLGKLNLNYIWLQLGPLGKKTGWNEYWEGRRLLDEVLAVRPDHVRARIGRAWIDYIVDTRMPRMTKWVLGGGNKKRGLSVVEEVANNASAEPFVAAEAIFALWDMQVREKQIPSAILTARRLAREFPDNPDLAKFLAANEAQATTR